jgi:hypothetical protein
VQSNQLKMIHLPCKINVASASFFLAVMAVQCVLCNGIPVLINYLKAFTRKQDFIWNHLAHCLTFLPLSRERLELFFGAV